MMHGYTKYILSAVLLLLLLGGLFTLQKNFSGGVEDLEETNEGETNQESFEVFSPTALPVIELESMTSEEYARRYSFTPEQMRIFEETARINPVDRQIE